MKISAITILTLLIFSFAVSAAPSITINSPTNTTYSEYGPIPINVTSNETVNFYWTNVKSGRKSLLQNASSSYYSNLYGSRGTINFTIFANNSNGFELRSVVFTINHSSIINVTTCGGLASPNTTYVLQNNINREGGCITLGSSDFIFDMNGFTVSGDGSGSVGISGNCNDVYIINGRVIASETGIFFDEGSKCQVKNVSIEAEDFGVHAVSFYSSLLEKVSIKNATVGIFFDELVNNIFMKNLTLTSNKNPSFAFYTNVFDGVFSLENSNISGFTSNMYFDPVNNMDWYLRNNDMNITSIKEDSQIFGRVRLFKEHLLKINTSNTIGQPIAASVEILDNGAFERTNRETNTYTFDSNPTGRVFIGTNVNGSAETWVAERLITVTTASPPSFEDVSFSPYTLIARAALAADQQANVSVILNSTIVSNFTLSTGGTSLPTCTINQMLDLDNNGVINSKDAQIILRKMVGHNVTVNGTKECNAINFFPV